jgi:hypothetical protein
MGFAQLVLDIHQVRPTGAPRVGVRACRTRRAFRLAFILTDTRISARGGQRQSPTFPSAGCATSEPSCARAGRGLPPHKRIEAHHGKQPRRVERVRLGERRRKRDSFGVDNEVLLGARFGGGPWRWGSFTSVFFLEALGLCHRRRPGRTSLSRTAVLCRHPLHRMHGSLGGGPFR